MITPTNYKLIIYDRDRTLCEFDSEEVYPEMKTFISYMSTPHIAIARNNGMVGLRSWIEQEGGFGDTPEEKAKSLADAQSRYGTPMSAQATMYRLVKQIKALSTDSKIKGFQSFRYLSRKGNWSPVPRDIIETTGETEPATGEWSRVWRKPQKGMILAAMEWAGVQPDETLFVGDSNGWKDEYENVHDEDIRAAMSAGVEFFAAQQILSGEWRI